MPLLDLFALVPRGTDDLVAAEAAACGGVEVAIGRSGVAWRGDLEAAYRFCLWSRAASRLLLPLATFPAADPEALYAGVAAVAWEDHLDPDRTLAVDGRARGAGGVNTHFLALKTKDAVVDRLREHCGRRPSVDLERPDLRLSIYLEGESATVALDLAGAPLHRRGYRGAGGVAPMKETLAAAVLLRAGWPALADAGGALVDPLCGSGTLLIEGAWIAGDVAPGLLRPRFGFHGWLGHRPALWRRLLAEAEERRAAGRQRLPPIAGSDADAQAVAAAVDGIERAGLAGRVRVAQCELARAAPPPGARPGLVATNPPYGERLGGGTAGLEELYSLLGRRLKEHFPGWRAAVLGTDPALLAALGMRASKRNTLYNGAIECRLACYEVATHR